MDFMAILQMIMMIISMIMELIGGGTFNQVLAEREPIYHLASYQWHCGEPYWTQAPEVKNNLFSGTVNQDCEVQGADGGGLIELRRHMVDQIPLSVSEVHQGPIVKSFQGLPSNAFDTSVEIASSEGPVALRGETNIATDGFTVLRNVFTSTRTPTEGSARYLAGLTDEVSVSPADREGWYRVRMSYSSRVHRPWYVSSRVFRDELVKKNEEKMIERRERVLNDLAAHL